jgi:hypothetical protein
MPYFAELPGIEPIATPESYAIAHELMEESYGKGGAWGDVAAIYDMRRSNPGAQKAFLKAASYGSLLSLQRLEVPGMPQPEIHQRNVGRAFAQGFFQQLDAQQLFYSDRFAMGQALEVMNAVVEDRNFDGIASPEDQSQAESEFMFAYSERGFQQMGRPAQQYVYDWAVETQMVDQRLQRAYTLGHGAMAYCGTVYQASANRHLLDTNNLEDRLGEEASAFLANGTSEERINLL